VKFLRAIVERLRRPANVPAPAAALPAAKSVAFDCSTWRQGDVFALDGLWITGDGGRPVWARTPYGVAVISQSCDAAQNVRDRIHVAPVVLLEGAQASEAASGKRISFAALPELGAAHFANLETVVTLPKMSLSTVARTPGVTEDEQVRRFAGSVSRKYGRFAFPDDVVRALDPLRDVLRSKARKEQTPLGRILADVYGVRIEATGGWRTPPYDLMLIVIFQPGVVPSFANGDLPDEPPGLRERVVDQTEGIETRGNQIAQAYQEATAPEERYWLIMLLAESWAAQCESSAVRQGVQAVVRSVHPDVVTADEFPLSRVNNSEDLDLDYLSEPLPRPPRAGSW